MFMAYTIIVIIAVVIILAVIAVVFLVWGALKLNGQQTPTNAPSLVGHSAKVVEEINKIAGTGRVTIDNLDWAAESVNQNVIISAGEIVKIVSIEGAKLVVDRI